MADTITLGFNIFCGVLLFFGIFWGLIRGLKKTVSRFLFILLTSVILLFVTAPLVKALLNIPFDTTIVINDVETLSEKMSLLELITHYIKEFLGEGFVQNNPEFTNLIIALPVILINSIVYVVLFWLLKLLLLPLNVLITHLIFPNKKKRKEVMGFSSMGDGPEYPNSDKSIDPLMEVYRNSEKEENSESQVGVFIKKDNEIGKDAPSAYSTKQVSSTQVVAPETKAEIRKQKKADRKSMKRYNKSTKPKKYRLWGGVVGAFVGVLIIFNTMIPVYGIMDIVSKHNFKQFDNFTEEPISISLLTNELSDDIIKGYELSIIGRLSGVLGLKKLGLTGFDTLTTQTVDDTRIVLRDDVDSIVNTMTEADKLIGLYKRATENGLENITQEDLTALITGTENLISTFEQTEFVNAASRYILPIAYEILSANDIKIVENEHVNDLILSTIQTVANNAEIDVFEELKAVVDLAKYLNDQKILINVVTNNYDGIIPVIHNLDADFNDKLTEKIFAIKTIDTTLPDVLHIGLSFLDNMVDFGYVENTATEEEIKTSFTTLINNLVNTARTLSEDSSIYVTDNSLVPLGKTLDTLRNSKLFNLDTYNNLLDYTLNKVKTMTGNLVPETFVDVFNNQLLRNISEVTSWENEMKVISDTLVILRDKDYGILGETTENSELRTGYTFHITICDETFVNIGKALDKLEQSVLLGTKGSTTLNSETYENTTLINLFGCILDELKSELSSDNTTMNDILGITDTLKNNLIVSEHLSDENSTFWEDEMTAISPLVIYISNIVNGDELEINNALGEALDTCAHNSVMFGGNTTLKLMEKIMNTVEDTILGSDFTPSEENTLNDNIYNLLQDIKTSLNSETTYSKLQADEHFWEKEMECFVALQDIAEDAENITSISSATAIASDLDLVYTSNIIPATSLNKTISTILKQLKTSETTGVTGQINNLIDDIATDISSDTFFDDKEKTNFWQIELGYISDLDNIKFEDDVYSGYSVIDNLPNIGATIDTIINGDQDTRGSYLITELRIRKILAVAITDMSNTILNSFEEDLKSSISTSLTEITTNIYNSEADTQIEIVSFESEFTHLKTLANLEISSDYFVYTPNISSLEYRLKVLGERLDSIAHNTTTTSNITNYDESKNSKLITRSNLSNIIASAFGTAKIDEPTQTLDTAFNNLITEIQASITNTTTTTNKVITWARELNYVSTLIQLNNPDAETVSLENVTETVTPYLDKIAFNEKNSNFADVTYQEMLDNDNQVIGYEIVGDYETSYEESDVTKYYNSVIITRSMLKNLMETILSDFIITGSPLSDVDTISNELITNLSSKINISNTMSNTLYSNYTEAFTDLNEVKNTMKAKAEYLDGTTYQAITEQDLIDLDKMLEQFQNLKVSGVVTTRKITLMILDKIENLLTENKTDYSLVTGTTLGDQLYALIDYFDANNNSASANYLVAEVYYTEETTTNVYANPLASLYEEISNIPSV